MAEEAAAAEQGTMDPELWGILQNHIDLEIIYAKLPFRQFFQLRLVCKEWNRLASDTAFLKNTYKDFLLPEPYFVLRASPFYEESPKPAGSLVCGLLACDPRTEQWTWTRLPHGNDFWSAAGLVLFDSPNSPQDSPYGEGSWFVFNLHTRHRFLFPPPPEQSSHFDPLIGMEVDTAARPYQYTIMQGNDDVPTQMYDSRTNTWSAKPSRHDFYTSPGQAMGAFAQGGFFIRCENDIVIYDTVKDVWRMIDPPPGYTEDDHLRGMGIWRDQIFHPSGNVAAIRVWKLTDITEMKWTDPEVATMPGELHLWLLYGINQPPVEPQILASYCFQWILFYAWWHDDTVTVECRERFVIFNLETKEFRKLELPFGLLNRNCASHGDLYAV